MLAVDTGGAPAVTWSEGPAELGMAVYAVARIPGGHRVTAGTVSAVDRSFRGPRGRLVTGGIEHTAPQARGTSGSPMVDAEGRLVGITTLRLGDGFSIAQPARGDCGPGSTPSPGASPAGDPGRRRGPAARGGACAPPSASPERPGRPGAGRGRTVARRSGPASAAAT